MSDRPARVIANWTASYPDPLVVRAGQQLTLGRVDTEWPFIWCTDDHGKSGWIPSSLIDRVSDEIGICRSNYDTKELDVTSGEQVAIERSEGGWSWVIAKSGQSGWVPDKCLALQDSLAKEEEAVQKPQYTSLKDVNDLVSQFEQGTLPREKWHHAAHLTVAFWYLSRLNADKALEKIRSGIKNYNAKNHIFDKPGKGYHETLTVFWAKIVFTFLQGRLQNKDSLETVNKLINEYGGRKDLFREFYSFDVLLCDEARNAWITPDVKLLVADNEMMMVGNQQ